MTDLITRLRAFRTRCYGDEGELLDATLDDEAREAGDSYKPLGWDCDRAEWERVRKLWETT